MDNSKNLEFNHGPNGTAEVSLPSAPTLNILRRLNVPSLVRCSEVSTTWNRVLNHYFEKVIFPKLPFIPEGSPRQGESWFQVLSNWQTVRFDPKQPVTLGHELANARRRMKTSFGVSENHLLLWGYELSGEESLRLFDVISGEEAVLYQRAARGTSYGDDHVEMLFHRNVALLHFSNPAQADGDLWFERVDLEERTVTRLAPEGACHYFSNISNNGVIACGDYTCQVCLLDVVSGQTLQENRPVRCPENENRWIRSMQIANGIFYATLWREDPESNWHIKVDAYQIDTWECLFSADLCQGVGLTHNYPFLANERFLVVDMQCKIVALHPFTGEKVGSWDHWNQYALRKSALVLSDQELRLQVWDLRELDQICPFEPLRNAAGKGYRIHLDGLNVVQVRESFKQNALSRIQRVAVPIEYQAVVRSLVTGEIVTKFNVPSPNIALSDGRLYSCQPNGKVSVWKANPEKTEHTVTLPDVVETITIGGYGENSYTDYARYLRDYAIELLKRASNWFPTWT